MSTNVVGSAYVEIHAITDKIGKEIQDAIKKTQVSGNAGSHIGEQLGKDVSKALKRSNASRDINKYGEKTSQDFNKHFTKSLFQGQGFGKNIKNALAVPLSNAGRAAEDARKQMVALASSSTKIPVIMAAVASSIGDVVGGLGGMIFGAAAAAPAFVAFAGTIVDAQLGLKVMKLAMDGVQAATSDLWKSQTALNDSLREASQQYIDIKFQAEGAALAQQGAALALQNAKVALIRAQDLPQNSQAYQQALLSYKQANLNYVQSIHKTQEATRAVRKGITATAAYQPFASLSGMQLALVKFMVTLRPAFQQLRTEVSNGFIPYLKTGIQDLVGKTLPALRGGIVNISSGMGRAIQQIFKIFTDPENIKNLQSIFKGAAQTLPVLGDAIKNVFSVVLRMLSAAQPLIKVFVGWIDKTAKSLNDKFSDKGKLTAFFNNAGVVAAKLGAIIGNVASILGSFIKANTDPGSGGQRLLDWIQHVSGDFAGFLKTAQGASGSFNWFQGAATNFMVMAHAVGGFIKPLFTLAGSPQIRAMWMNIGSAVPDIQAIAAGFQKAAPYLGGLIKQIIRMVALLTDAVQSTTFFATLELAARKVADFLSRPFVKSILGMLGPIVGVSLAVAKLLSIWNVAAKAIVGHVGFIGRATGLWTTKFNEETGKNEFAIGKTTLAFKRLQVRIGESMRSATKSVGMFLRGEKRATAATYEFDRAALRFRNTATGRFVPASEAMAAQGNIFKRAWFAAQRGIRGFGRSAVTAFKNFGAVLKGNWILLVIGLLVMAFIKLYNTNKQFAAFINGAMKKVLGTLSRALGSIMKALGPLIDILIGPNGLLGKLLKGLMPVLMMIVNILVAILVPAINIVVTIIDVLIGAVTLLIDYFMTLGKVWGDILTGNFAGAFNDAVNGAKKIGSDFNNTASAIGGAWNGSGPGFNGGSATAGPNTDGSGSGYGPGEAPWMTISKKNQEAAQTQLDAANKQLASAVKTEKNDPSKGNKVNVAIAKAAAAQAQQAKVNAMSAFDQANYYASKAGGKKTSMDLSAADQLYGDTRLNREGVSEKSRFGGNTADLIKGATLDALRTGAKTGKNKKAISQELLDYLAYNQTQTDVNFAQSKYDTLAATARKTGKKSDISAAATAFNSLTNIKSMFAGQQAAYKSEFANLAFDPKTGKVTINGAPTSTTGSTTANTSTTTDANGNTTSTTAPGTSTTSNGKGGTTVVANGTSTAPYYTIIKGLVETDWQAIKKDNDSTVTTLASVVAQLVLANNWLKKVNENSATAVEYAKESNIRDQAMLEYTLHKDKKAKIAGVNIGGQNMSSNAFEVLSTKVTGISGVAGFNATGS